MNKKIPYLLLAFLVITGCTSQSKEQIKIATSTRHLGENYLAQGNPIAALKELTDAQKITPDDPYIHYALGMVYYDMGKYGLSESHLKRAIELKPGYTEAMNSLGGVLMKQKKWDGAIALFRQTAGNLLYTTPHFPLSNMGWAFLHKGDYMNAEASFKKALKAKPDFINAIHGLTSVYLAKGQTRLSRQSLEKALAKYPHSAILHADLAKTLEILGLRREARQSWLQVISLAPGSELSEKATKQVSRLSP